MTDERARRMGVCRNHSRCHGHWRRGRWQAWEEMVVSSQCPVHSCNATVGSTIGVECHGRTGSRAPGRAGASSAPAGMRMRSASARGGLPDPHRDRAGVMPCHDRGHEDATRSDSSGHVSGGSGSGTADRRGVGLAAVATGARGLGWCGALAWLTRIVADRDRAMDSIPTWRDMDRTPRPHVLSSGLGRLL